MNSEIQLCLLTPIDIKQINEISYHFWKEDGIYPLSELLRLLESNLSYGYKIKDELIAFCLIENLITTGEIYLFPVKHTYHRMGFGKKLMKWCISNANLCGLNHFALNVQVDNDPGKKLYRSVGFEIVKLIKGYYNEQNTIYDAYRMELTIPSSPQVNQIETHCQKKSIDFELN